MKKGKKHMENTSRISSGIKTSINLQMLVKRSISKAFFEAPITMGFGKKKTWVAMGRAWWWNAW